MSLIDEALKRARQEAAQRAAEREGLPYPAIPRHHPGTGGRRWPIWAALAALALGIGAAGGAWLATAGRPGTPEPAAHTADRPAGAAAEPGEEVPAAAPPAAPAPAAEPVAGEPSPAATAASAAARIGVSPPAAASAPSRATAPPGPAATDPPSPPRRVPAAAAVSPEPPTGAPPAPAAEAGVVLVLPEPRAASEPAGAPPASSDASPEEHVQIVETGAGARIELGGIAWSETGPFALLNGRVLATGATIEAYEVVHIGPRFVEMRGEGRTVRLNLP